MQLSKGAITRASFCQYWRSFLPILAAKSERSVTRSQVFSYQYWHFRSSSFFLSALAPENTTCRPKQDGQRLQTTYSTYRIKFVVVKPSNEEETYVHLFAYSDFQNCRRSSARSQTKTKIVNKDASISGKDDDL